MDKIKKDGLAPTEKTVACLRERVRPYLTEKRYAHTLAVEKEVAVLADIYLPDKKNKLRCSALLHDITKRLSFEKQLQYCDKFGIIVGKGDMLSPKTLHAKTGAALAAADFPDFTDDEIISGIRWHTTGRRDMTLYESLVYLADYIEETRDFEDCVKLRKFFYGCIEDNNITKEEALTLSMIRSFDMTVNNLINESAPIDSDTVDARNYFIEMRKCGKGE